MSDIVIKAEHLSKYYRLGVINNGTLFRDIQTWLALKRGKQDPHSKIGEHKYKGTDEGFWALKDLNFEIKQGDRVGIIGKNGAGKSTLLKILSRITAPTEGCVKIHGRVASLLEVGTGFHGELTGRENVYLNGAILGMKKREVDRKIDEIIDFSGIEKHIDTPVKRYSSGMYVRLAFAVAAHLDSEILIADEVLAVGDAEFQKKALGKMNELSTGQGRTVLFVSHNMAAVKSLCNRGMLLNKGSIRYAGNLKKTIGIYLNNHKTITLLKSTTYSKDICKIEDFQINGQNTNEIFLNTLRFSIFLKGTVLQDFNYSIEIRFYDSDLKPVFTYSPGHITGILSKTINKEILINDIIQFPCNISNGIYYAYFSITRPGFKTYLSLSEYLRFNIQILLGENKMEYPYFNWGVFVFGD